MNRVILCMVLFIGVLSSCKQKQPPPNLPVPVNLFTVTDQHVLYYEKYPGTTQALSQVEIRPQVQGYVSGIFFTEGSLVRKGQKLYELDQRLYKQAYDAADANLKVAQGNLLQAQQDADRYIYLNKENAIAKQTLDHAMIALQNAQNQVKASEEAKKTAATNFTYSVITAPFDGTIGFSQVKIGDMASAGSTVLNTISTNNPIAVDFLVNEKQLTHYEDLLKGGKNLPDSLFTILLPNGTLYPQLGKISIIDRAVDQQTGSIRVRLVFPNPVNTLKVGMSCVVQVHNQDVGPQMVVPNKAVVEQMGEYFVFVAKDSTITEHATAGNANAGTVQNKEKETGPKLRAFQRKVQLGQQIGPDIIIKGGIQSGDKIVVDGVQSLHDGSRIATGTAPAHDSTGNKKGS
ncbi:efflux RND transporter periplasmic adaptor subunit [Chitinophagaceae bacterium LWZ2-11]